MLSLVLVVFNILTGRYIRTMVWLLQLAAGRPFHFTYQVFFFQNATNSLSECVAMTRAPFPFLLAATSWL